MTTNGANLEPTRAELADAKRQARRTPDGWSGTLALDIAASGRPKSRY